MVRKETSGSKKGGGEFHEYLQLVRQCVGVLYFKFIDIHYFKKHFYRFKIFSKFVYFFKLFFSHSNHI